MKRIVLLATALIGLAAPVLADPIAGYDRLTVKAPHRPEPLAASLWYPIGTPTYRGLIGDNPVFRGTEAYVGAAIADGRHPLVLLSHGSGGNMDTLSWFSSQLAARGAMVLGANHPGSTTGDSSPRRSMELSDRASDLSAALDSVLADPTYAPHIDTSHIVAFGFSLGGATALNLAGARMNRAQYQDYCARLGDKAVDCIFFAKGGVDLGALPDAWESDMREPRVTAAIAVDPGMSYAFTQASVAALDMPVLLINLGGDERWAAGDVGPHGSDLAGRLPHAEYTVVVPGNHFTFLAECKPGARELLIEEGEDPICDDPAGTDRGRVHMEIIEKVAAFLKL